jgi:hypothetical protein
VANDHSDVHVVSACDTTASSVLLKIRFRSSIPSTARARVVSRYKSGAPCLVEYVRSGKVVGYRCFSEEGAVEQDVGLRDGLRHGTTWRLDRPGVPTSATPYRHGLQHGLARQWNEQGRLIGWYRMHRGTGVDLWWQESWQRPGRCHVSEAHCEENGQSHGYEWWLSEDQQSVWHERHWWRGEMHGIEREWNSDGRLRRGSPAYFVKGERVTRRVYERARTTDPTLPAYRVEDNRPQRKFPAIVARRLSRTTSRR